VSAPLSLALHSLPHGHAQPTGTTRAGQAVSSVHLHWTRAPRVGCARHGSLELSRAA
jgi:hypothetical protein